MENQIDLVRYLRKFFALLAVGSALECGSESPSHTDIADTTKHLGEHKGKRRLPPGIGHSSETRAGIPAFPKAKSKPLKLPPGWLKKRNLLFARELSMETTVDLNVLVIAADGTEADLPLIKQVLDYLGTPYTVWTAASNPNALTADKLYQGNRAFYQGVILTTSTLGYEKGGAYLSALSPTEWQTLNTFESMFNIRQVTFYSYPTPDLGFATDPFPIAPIPDSPCYARLTSAGSQIFGYMNPAAAIPIVYAYTYLANAAASATPVITDDSGHALGVVQAYPDGRENLAFTFDSAPYLLHSVSLGYGVVNWVTRGQFLGERHVYLDAQEDDTFLSDDIYGGSTYRLTGDDWQKFVAWQRNRQSMPVTSGLRINHAFNGDGYAPTDDPLSDAITNNQGDFFWTNHTYTHLNLDAATYDETKQELQRNINLAPSLGFSHFSKRSLVTPDISGLYNQAALDAMWDVGVRYVVSDTSRLGMENPSPNAGIYNWFKPGILMIPRRPNNLFYNVTTPAEWVDEYNFLYRSFWGHDVNYDELLDKESDVLLNYLLKGENDPWMFHQSNLRAYDGVHSLLGALIDRVMAKYSLYYKVPVVSLTQDELGQRVAARMAYNDAGITASLKRGATTVLSITAQKKVTVPVTGVRIGSYETYGDQPISYIDVDAGQTVDLTIE